MPNSRVFNSLNFSKYPELITLNAIKKQPRYRNTKADKALSLNLKSLASQNGTERTIA
jgi:hypothetical protein